jgi:hypothetical protein
VSSTKAFAVFNIKVHVPVRPDNSKKNGIDCNFFRPDSLQDLEHILREAEAWFLKTKNQTNQEGKDEIN